MMGVGEYYNREISEVLIDIYLEGLKHYDYETLSKAAQLHMSNPDTGQFFPKISDFVKHIGGGNSDKALEAWTKFDKAVRTVGPYRTVVFDDAIIHAVISDMGGWIEFGNKSLEEWPFIRNEFVKRFHGYLLKGVPTDYPAKITGIADMHNQEIGIVNNKETVLIGHQQKALEVLRLGANSGVRNPVTLLSDYRPKTNLRIEK